MEQVHGGFEILRAGRALAAVVARLGGEAVRVIREMERRWERGSAMVERLNDAKGDALEKIDRAGCLL